MLVHQGIGLDGFNNLPTRCAVHAVYGVAGYVTMAAELAAVRPYASREELFERVEALLAELPADDADREELARITRARLEELLGPEGGYQNWV
ncbi:hypothetical protein [Mycolicibacterium brumae]|uniref:OHCU decarboxylase n=1 Tax=Mycolicibacterium brumae TaxID=85968 RepID=A0A2G5P6X6_9MYCO|nr:hypothetical protein [Mycolicibacterium brumae]MCV7193773.1 OHCU decarboxylase [Mycolicibacterium brumae]PIB74017.1 OHCU decarboxylase [Mycolicibacterium brumae]RWA21465.1 hypothetical protein MBRU_14730 [Mycolicibacterium brumae DSM 44177]UWW07324.1 OHCU decarboxylase [Mycolicibacterium brumae]